MERVLFKETDTAKSGMQVRSSNFRSEQNAIIVKKDDVTFFTGGEDGTLRSYRFELKGDANRRYVLHAFSEVQL